MFQAVDHVCYSRSVHCFRFTHGGLFLGANFYQLRPPGISFLCLTGFSSLIGFSKCLKVMEFPLDVVQFPKAAFCSMFSFLNLRCQFGFAKACFSLKHSFFL